MDVTHIGLTQRAITHVAFGRVRRRIARLRNGLV